MNRIQTLWPRITRLQPALRPRAAPEIFAPKSIGQRNSLGRRRNSVQVAAQVDIDGTESERLPTPLPKRLKKWWYPEKNNHLIGVVCTLRPDRMQEVRQRAHTIAGHHTGRFYFKIKNPTGDRNFITPYYHFTPSLRQHPRFPPRTRGILYYHQPQPDEPVMSGQLRFRLCDGFDGFDQGSDMLDANGIDTWHLSLHTLVKSFYLRCVVDMLLQEGIVDQTVIEQVARLPRLHTDAPVLYTYDWPFVVDLSQPSLRLAVMNLEMFEVITLPFVFQHHLPQNTPYKGRVRARFELSTSCEHEIVPTLVLRILEHIDPIKCIIPDYNYFIAEPTPGSLLSKRVSILHDDAKHGPWAYPLYSRPQAELFRKLIGIP